MVSQTLFNFSQCNLKNLKQKSVSVVSGVQKVPQKVTYRNAQIISRTTKICLESHSVVLNLCRSQFGIMHRSYLRWFIEAKK